MTDTDQKKIQTRLSVLFSEVLHVDVPSVDTDLFNTGILDSQRFVELLLFIEQNFETHIDVQDFEIENFRCIEKIAALILQHNHGGRQDAQFSQASGVFPD
jgi:methoxymalonate biosynthesis acyl carrier protein